MLGLRLCTGARPANHRRCGLCPGNKLGVRGAVSIAAAFAPDAHGFSNHTITCLMLRNNHIGEGDNALDGFAAFGEVLAKNEHITHLDLSGNSMGPEGAAALFAGVARSASLQTLALDDNQVQCASVLSENPLFEVMPLCATSMPRWGRGKGNTTSTRIRLIYGCRVDCGLFVGTVRV